MYLISLVKTGRGRDTSAYRAVDARRWSPEPRVPLVTMCAPGRPSVVTIERAQELQNRRQQREQLVAEERDQSSHAAKP